MDSTQISLLIFGIIFCVAVQNAEGGKCYQCNSAAKYEGELCEKPDIKLLKDCGNVTTNFCRLIKQNVDGDYRIIRDCATLVREDGFKCIHRSGTAKIKITYCECDGEGCNSANTNIVKPLVLLFTAIVTLIATKFNS